jgi:hypothetical protein
VSRKLRPDDVIYRALVESVFLGPPGYDWIPVRYVTVAVGIVTYAAIWAVEVVLYRGFGHVPFPLELMAAVFIAWASSRVVGIERLPNVIFTDFIAERRHGRRKFGPATEVHIRAARVRVQPREYP